MGKQSFFAEKRSSNNNPNFFNFMSIEEIRRNVKRIIKDIKFDNIQDNDYIYFNNPKVISACIQECKSQYESAKLIYDALNYYVSYIYNQCPPSAEKNKILFDASNARGEYNNRYATWQFLFDLFKYIDYGYDPKETLKQIQQANLNISCL